MKKEARKEVETSGKNMEIRSGRRRIRKWEACAPGVHGKGPKNF